MSYLSKRCIKSYLNASYRCLIGDDLQISYQKMSCRCLVRDDLKMFYIFNSISKIH